MITWSYLDLTYQNVCEGPRCPFVIFLVDRKMSGVGRVLELDSKDWALQGESCNFLGSQFSSTTGSYED